MLRKGPLHLQALEGAPITIGDRTLIPQAQLVTWCRRRGTVTARGFGGSGWACGLLIPKAVIERRSGQERRIPIPDRTAQALMAMAVVGLAIATASALVQVLFCHRGPEREDTRWN